METETNNFALPKLPFINKDDDVCPINEEIESDDDDWYPFSSYEDMVEYEINRLMEKD